MTRKTDIRRKNKIVAFGVATVVVCMIGLSFAAVPLYDLFCRVTGFGGTTQVSETLPDQVLEREITVKFYADTARNMPWHFAPQQRQVITNIGAKNLIAYTAINKSDTPVTGTAIYNVTPLKVGKYFHKVQCFCFGEQVLRPGEKVNMPVMFYVDPALADDKSMDDISVITLSYTFYRAETEALEDAVEAFYNQEAPDNGATISN